MKNKSAEERIEIIRQFHINFSKAQLKEIRDKVEKLETNDRNDYEAGFNIAIRNVLEILDIYINEK